MYDAAMDFVSQKPRVDSVCGKKMDVNISLILTKYTEPGPVFYERSTRAHHWGVPTAC